MSDIIFGLRLAVIGITSVFAILILIMVLIKVIEKFWGPKQTCKTKKEG